MVFPSHSSPVVLKLTIFLPIRPTTHIIMTEFSTIQITSVTGVASVNCKTSKQQLRPVTSGTSGTVPHILNCKHKTVQSQSNPNHKHTQICSIAQHSSVIAQQYSSSIFITLHYHSRKAKFVFFLQKSSL
jgi:hypothetical protein